MILTKKLCQCRYGTSWEMVNLDVHKGFVPVLFICLRPNGTVNLGAQCLCGVAKEEASSCLVNLHVSHWPKCPAVRPNGPCDWPKTTQIGPRVPEFSSVSLQSIPYIPRPHAQQPHFLQRLYLLKQMESLSKGFLTQERIRCQLNFFFKFSFAILIQICSFNQDCFE